MTEDKKDLKELKEEMLARVSKLDEQQKQISAKKRAIRARFAQKERKARTKRLIEKGALLEKFIGADAPTQSLDQTQAILQNLGQTKHNYRALKAFTQGIKYEDNTSVFSLFLSEYNKQRSSNGQKPL